MQKFLYGSANIALFIAGIANLGIGTLSAWNAEATMAVASLTAGLVLIFAATVDRFESIKGLGVEAKTKKLDEKIEQADEALEKLKELTELTCGTLIELSSCSGRWSGPPTARTAIELAAKTRSIMSSLGSDPAVIKAALRPWAEVMCKDRVQPIRRELNNLMDREKKALRDQLQQFSTPINAGDPAYQELTQKIQKYGSFVDSVHQQFNKLTLDDFPEKYLEILDAACAEIRVDTDAAKACRDKAARLAPDLRKLRVSHELNNAEEWIAALDDAHKATA